MSKTHEGKVIYFFLQIIITMPAPGCPTNEMGLNEFPDTSHLVAPGYVRVLYVNPTRPSGIPNIGTHRIYLRSDVRVVFRNSADYLREVGPVLS
jgi:hypothetical protein